MILECLRRRRTQSVSVIYFYCNDWLKWALFIVTLNFEIQLSTIFQTNSLFIILKICQANRLAVNKRNI